MEAHLKASSPLSWACLISTLPSANLLFASFRQPPSALTLTLFSIKVHYGEIICLDEVSRVSTSVAPTSYVALCLRVTTLSKIAQWSSIDEWLLSKDVAHSKPLSQLEPFFSRVLLLYESLIITMESIQRRCHYQSDAYSWKGFACNESLLWGTSWKLCNNIEIGPTTKLCVAKNRWILSKIK